jgi:hypothetical protein
MMNPTVMNQVAKERQKDFLRQAEAHRMAAEANGTQHRLTERLVEELGTLLVAVSERLKENDVPTQSEATC